MPISILAVVDTDNSSNFIVQVDSIAKKKYIFFYLTTHSKIGGLFMLQEVQNQMSSFPLLCSSRHEKTHTHAETVCRNLGLRKFLAWSCEYTFLS